jgi:serine protease AprX
VLLQNAPNPFRTSATITYRLAAPGHARLGVYDVLGRRVRTLVDGSQSAGEHRVTLQREDLPAGTYFYRLEANGETHGKRFILLD